VIEALPFKPGDWAVDHIERVAKVKAVYRDCEDILLDLVIYDWKGNRVGRESPVCGGPRSFEPACDAKDWQRIARPAFPVTPKWMPNETGGVTARTWAGQRLPPANYTPKPRRTPASAPATDPALRLALEQIADGHNDARALAKSVLRRRDYRA
jgi:hypothetical protein